MVRTRSALRDREDVVAAVPRVLRDHVVDAAGFDVARDALDAARDFILIGRMGETRDAASDARVEIPLGLMLPAIEKEILQTGTHIVFFFALDSKSRRVEDVNGHESLVRCYRFFGHHSWKVFVQPAMPHLLGCTVENHQARVRREHAMDLPERSERVRHMMMYEGAGRAVETAGHERDCLRSSVAPCDCRRLLLRPLEH